MGGVSFAVAEGLRELTDVSERLDGAFVRLESLRQLVKEKRWTKSRRRRRELGACMFDGIRKCDDMEVRRQNENLPVHGNWLSIMGG